MVPVIKRCRYETIVRLPINRQSPLANNVVQTLNPTRPAASQTGNQSGLMILSIPNSAVSTAQRVIAYDHYVEVLGVAYDDVQGTYGVSFICQIDIKTQNQNVIPFQLADVYQTTVAQNFAIDFKTGTRCIVGYHSTIPHKSTPVMHLRFDSMDPEKLSKSPDCHSVATIFKHSVPSQSTPSITGLSPPDTPNSEKLSIHASPNSSLDHPSHHPKNNSLFFNLYHCLTI